MMPQACHNQAQILQISNSWNTSFEESIFEESISVKTLVFLWIVRELEIMSRIINTLYIELLLRV